MGFAVGDAAANGGADAGSVGGIDEIHIEADGDACGVVHGVLQGFGHDVAQATLVNVAHGEDVDAGFLDDFAFLRVEIPGTDNDDVARLGLGFKAEKVDDLLFVFAEIVGDSGGYPCGDGVVTSKNERKKTFTQRSFSRSGNIGAGFGNFLQVFGAFFADGHFFRLLDGKVADVFDLQAQL